MQRITTWMLILLVPLLSACQNLKPAQAPLLRLEGVHDFGVTRIAFSKNGRLLASGGFRGGVIIWRIPSGKRVVMLKKHDAEVRGLVWMSSTRLISAAEDGRLVLWDLETGKALKTVRTQPVTSTAVYRRKGLLLTGHANGQLQLRRLSDFSLLRQRLFKARVVSVAVHEQTGRLAVSTDNTKVRLLSGNLETVRELKTPGKNALELRFSPDGRQLAAGAWFRLLLWNTATGSLTVRRTEHTGAIISIDYSPDGQRLVSLGRHTDANIRLLNLKAGRLERRLAPHNWCGWQVRFSPDGRYVASASEDESIRLYDLRVAYRPSFNWANQGPVRHRE